MSDPQLSPPSITSRRSPVRQGARLIRRFRAERADFRGREDSVQFYVYLPPRHRAHIRNNLDEVNRVQSHTRRSMAGRTLRAKLSLGIALLIILSVGLMAGLAVWRSAEALRQRALVSNHTVALAISHSAQQYLADSVAIMREAAERPKLHQEITSGNWNETRKVLENIGSHFRQLDYIFVQDADGIIRARVPHAETVGEDFSSHDFFRGAMQARQPYLSGVHVLKGSGRPVVAIGVPVVQADGRVAAVLVGALSLETMRRLVAVAAHDDGRAIYLVDTQGRLVADSRAAVESVRDMRAEPVVHEVLSGRAGTMMYREHGRGPGPRGTAWCCDDRPRHRLHPGRRRSRPRVRPPSHGSPCAVGRGQ